jgi:glycosyltransferase involved in cell wall biosynthesis
VVMVPGSLGTLTGGYGYDRRMVAGLRARGWRVTVSRLDDSFPWPTAAARANASRALGAVPDDHLVLVDGLALGAMPEEVEREAERLPIVGLVHHPLADETGLAPEVASALARSEKRALAAVRLVVVTSDATARRLAREGVNPNRVAVVEPGTDPFPVARGSGDTSVHMVCVATLIPRKGHAILFQALESIAQRNWRLTCLGSVHRHPETAQRLREMLEISGLAGRVELVGEIDPRRVAAAYDRADLFVLPTLYEGYGMAVAEALASGLPVVSTATGAIPDLVGQDAGIIVPPGDQSALAAALSRVIDDPRVRAELARGARRVRDRLPTWDVAAARLAQALTTR